MLVRVKHHMEPRLQRNAMSIMSLMVSPDSKPAHFRPLLPRPASRFYRRQKGLKKTGNAQQSSKLFAWGRASGNTLLLDSSMSKMFHSLNQSRAESPKPESKPESRSVTRMLKTNESAFTAAEFTESKMQLKRVSKLNKSYSGKALSRDPPGIEDAYAPAYQNGKCCGKFCNEEVDLSTLIYNRGSRFLVAQELIDLHSIPQIRMRFPVKSRLEKHRDTPSEISGAMSVNKLVARGESALLPVCLKCYLTYDKMRKMGANVKASFLTSPM